MKKQIIIFLALMFFISFCPQVFADEPKDPNLYGNYAFPSASSGWSIGSVSIFGLPTGKVSAIVEAILEWLLALIGIVGIIGFIISGAMYILSVGDDTSAKTAKSAMMNSIIGIVVALSGFVIIQAVNSMLNSFTDF